MPTWTRSNGSWELEISGRDDSVVARVVPGGVDWSITIPWDRGARYEGASATPGEARADAVDGVGQLLAGAPVVWLSKAYMAATGAGQYLAADQLGVSRSSVTRWANDTLAMSMPVRYLIIRTLGLVYDGQRWSLAGS